MVSLPHQGSPSSVGVALGVLTTLQEAGSPSGSLPGPGECLGKAVDPDPWVWMGQAEDKAQAAL